MDYLGPKIINQVYGVDSWTPSKERQFDEVCENVVLGMDKLESLWNLLREARSSKPVFHFVGTLMFFFSLAALGNRINNFFLAYLVTNFALLMPGLYKKGILQQLYAQTTLKFAEIVKGKDYLKKAEWIFNRLLFSFQLLSHDFFFYIFCTQHWHYYVLDISSWQPILHILDVWIINQILQKFCSFIFTQNIWRFRQASILSIGIFSCFEIKASLRYALFRV